jgi:cysteine synthase
MFSNILETIGHSPLVRINRMNPNPAVTLAAKLEGGNPGGSVKDRPALSMIEGAEHRGELTKEKIILEPTSGNTGIGLAMVGAVKGYRVLVILPESMSTERRRILRAYGADFILTPAEKGTDGAIERAHEIYRANPQRYYFPISSPTRTMFGPTTKAPPPRSGRIRRAGLISLWRELGLPEP